MAMSLGKAIRLVRTARDMTHQELADRIGSASSYLSLIENNQRIPSWLTLQRICEALGVKLTLLVMLTEADDPAIAPYMPLIYKAIIERRPDNGEQRENPDRTTGSNRLVDILGGDDSDSDE